MDNVYMLSFPKKSNDIRLFLSQDGNKFRTIYLNINCYIPYKHK